MKRIAMALVGVGFVALALGGIGYDRPRTVLAVGGLKATATEHSTIPYLPILGFMSVIGGIALLVGVKRTGLNSR